MLYNPSTCTDGSTYDGYAITHYTVGSITATPVTNAPNTVTGFRLSGATGGEWAALDHLPHRRQLVPGHRGVGPDTWMPTAVALVQVGGKDVPVTPFEAPRRLIDPQHGELAAVSVGCSTRRKSCRAWPRPPRAAARL